MCGATGGACSEVEQQGAMQGEQGEGEWERDRRVTVPGLDPRHVKLVAGDASASVCGAVNC